MSPNLILVWCAIPLVGLVIAVVKTAEKWLPELKALPRLQQVAVVIVLGFAVSWGGSKGPGPTKSNLRLLLAERAKLSNGQAYGPKSDVVAATAKATAAAMCVTNAINAGDTMNTTFTNATALVAVAESGPRYYIRLTSPSPVVTNQTLYAEIQSITVGAGVAEAAVWFNIIPNSEPTMRFNFAADSATNLWFTAEPSGSTFPDTFVRNGRTCYLYYFAVPEVLLNEAEDLVAPLQWEKRVAFGSPETGEPFDIRGGLAIVEDGEYYLAVTGYRTNGVGQVFYFDNGRLATPPMEEP